MPTISPEQVVAASSFVSKSLDAAKRRAVAEFSLLWSTTNVDDIRGTVQPILPRVAEIMHEQQAIGRTVAWKQAQLATALASPSVEPGHAAMALSKTRDGLLQMVPYENAVQPAVPGILSRIQQGENPNVAMQAGQQILATMVGSVAHQEARNTAVDVITGVSGDTHSINGYARVLRGAENCDFCRMLATRGPVYYTGETGNFRAHRACDCQVLSVAMSDFHASQADWDGYRRWAQGDHLFPHGIAKGPNTGQKFADYQYGKTTTQRLKVIDQQIATFQPVVSAGDGTAWMDTKLTQLKAERAKLIDDLQDQTRNTVAVTDDSWKLRHRAPGPSPDGSGSLVDMTSLYPSDFYSHPEYYEDMRQLAAKQSFAAISNVRGDPAAKVTVYRASPAGTEIQNGDWVTLSEAYARQHGMGRGPDGTDFPVHRKVVRADELWTEANSINEFGYYAN